MTAPHVWTTQAGDKIEVRWMTTPHLIHSFNMLMRRNKLTRIGVMPQMVRNKDDVFGAMYREITIRQQFRWNGDEQLSVQGIQRETPVQLALLRALIDADPKCDDLIASFYERPQTVIDQVFADPAMYAPVIAKFTEYRMAQA